MVDMKATIISSFAEDILINESGIERREGGPALFISNVFKEFKMPFDIFTGKKSSVEIDMRKNVEKGRIISLGKILQEIPAGAELVLISTLLDEFELKAIGSFCCLDLQGYVRNGKDFGKKKNFDSEELERFDVIKATKEEIEYIPKSRKEKIKLLLLTNEENGFEILKDGKIYSFVVEKIEAKNTIGAGDTFFASFCLEYYQTRDILKSVEFAKSNTAIFLKNKL